MRAAWLCVACALLAGCAAMPRFLLSGSSSSEKISVYDPRANRDREISVIVYSPPRKSPARPAVIFLSGCDGGHWLTHHAIAKQLNERGAVVAEVQSIEAFGNQCGPGRINLPGSDRTGHAFLARDWLIRNGLAAADNVALVGLSHGGWTAVHAALMDVPLVAHAALMHRQPFTVGVALYPYCDAWNTPRRSVSTPLLVLGGSDDTWTPLETCRRFLSQDPAVTIHEYKGATHAWDAPLPPRTIVAHTGAVFMAEDRAATADGIRRSMEFILRHLKFD